LAKKGFKNSDRTKQGMLNLKVDIVSNGLVRWRGESGQKRVNLIRYVW